MKARTQRVLANLTLANQLTFLRLVTVPFFVILILQGRFGLALGLFLAAAVTDVLDGVSARWLGQKTSLGAYLDPAADKLLLTATFVMLTEYPVLFQQIPMVARIPIWLTILTIFRDVSIVAIALILYLTYGQTRFAPSFLGKLTTTVEFLTAASFLLANSLGRSGRLLVWAVWLTLGCTLVSGFQYLWRTIRSVHVSEGSRANAR